MGEWLITAIVAYPAEWFAALVALVIGLIFGIGFQRTAQKERELTPEETGPPRRAPQNRVRQDLLRLGLENAGIAPLDVARS